MRVWWCGVLPWGDIERNGGLEESTDMQQWQDKADLSAPQLISQRYENVSLSLITVVNTPARLSKVYVSLIRI